MRLISPGTIPRSHTLIASGSGLPAPCTKNQTAQVITKSPMVITGVRSVGLSSEIGNIALRSGQIGRLPLRQP